MKKALRAALLGMVVALAVGILPPDGGPARANGSPRAGSGWERLDADEPAPGFALTDQNGRRVALADLRGSVAIVTFLFTHCTDVCPVLPQILARVDQHVGEAERSRLRYVGISIDPRRDTPRRLREFIGQHRLDAARWTLLTGSIDTLTKVATDYGVVVRPAPRGDFVHNTVFAVIDPSGRLRVEFHGLATPPDEIARAVRGLLKPAPK
jgi:protein SCO1/2